MPKPRSKRPPIYVKLKDTGCLHDILQLFDMASPDTPEDEAKAIAKIASMSPFELLDAYLEWNGIIHYTQSIVEVISCLPHQQLMQYTSASRNKPSYKRSIKLQLQKRDSI